MAFVDALRALNTMKAEGVIEEYAIAGAMALVFWTEPVPTFDLDVLVLLPTPLGDLVSLGASIDGQSLGATRPRTSTFSLKGCRLSSSRRRTRYRGKRLWPRWASSMRESSSAWRHPST